jgi:hypothetical protein
MSQSNRGRCKDWKKDVRGGGIAARHQEKEQSSGAQETVPGEFSEESYHETKGKDEQ